MPSSTNDHRGELVYLTEERTYGEVVGPVGAYYTLIAYTKGGIDYEVLVENEDYIPLEDFFLNYEP